MRVLNEKIAFNGLTSATKNLVIDTFNLKSLSIVNVFTPDVTNTAKTFIAGVKATKVIQDITYTAANAYGPAGNLVSVTYTGGATAGSEVVTVVGNDITIQIATGVSTATQVKAKFDASGAATALAAAAITGTAGNAQVVASKQLLTGGTGQVDIANNVIQVTAHGWSTGRAVVASTGGTLPSPLTATTYYAVVIDADTLGLATNVANATAASPVLVDLTTIGVGTQTLTPTAIAGCSVKLQETNYFDGTNYSQWQDVSGASTSITVAGASVFKPNIDCRYINVVFTITTGQVNMFSYICGKGD